MLSQNDILLGLERICAAVPDLATVKLSIEAMRVLVEGAYDVDITDDEQTMLLKAYTGEVFRLQIDLNCYPLGLTTQVLFDADGNLVS